VNWQSTVFNFRFSRCRKMLFFLACRVLGSPEQVHDVMENCKIAASRNPPIFESEGAFRSWLVRILIDEALAIVRQRKSAITKVQEDAIRLPQRD
jgi:DNA-directed RNA polymerase specialized sigma24 family protein